MPAVLDAIGRLEISAGDVLVVRLADEPEYEQARELQATLSELRAELKLRTVIVLPPGADLSAHAPDPCPVCGSS